MIWSFDGLFKMHLRSDVSFEWSPTQYITDCLCIFIFICFEERNFTILVWNTLISCLITLDNLDWTNCKISCSSWYFSSYTTLLSDLTKLKRFKYINQSFRCTIRSLSTKNTRHVFSIRSLIYLMLVFYFFHYDWSYFLMLFYESLLICFDDWVSKFHIF